MDRERVRIAVVGVLDAVVVVVVVGVVVEFDTGGLFKLFRDVTDRHKVSFGNEIPKAAIRQSNLDVNKKLKQYEKKKKKNNEKKKRAIFPFYPKNISIAIDQSKVLLCRSISEETDQGFLTQSSHNTPILFLFLYSLHCRRSSSNNQQY